MLNVSRRILVSAPRDSVQKYLSDLSEIAKYEPKVHSIEVSPAVEGQAAQDAALAGRFFGLPWHGVFRFERTSDGGYRGSMVSGPLRRAEIRMALRPVIGGTSLEHQETYELPLYLRPLSALIRRWLDKTLESELDSVKEGAEGLNRRLQLQRLDA
ncbi:MAG TPA: SRPBCC family protein [Elusimicrobiota bacterium]|nr:SRPBCC family protein [Elusimicrobiota bacterium]